MTIARKAIVWGLFAVGGTLSSFVLPAVILLFLLVASGHVPIGLEYPALHTFAGGLLGKTFLFFVIALSLWHSAHRLRVVFHDFGVRKDPLVAKFVYLIAGVGTVLTAYYLYLIH